MARYTDANCKLCRREGQKLFLKGERCYSPKCALEKRNYAPGQHGQARKKQSEYGTQLREKQKAKRFYGVQETQFRNLFEKCAKKQGKTGEEDANLWECIWTMLFELGLRKSELEPLQVKDINFEHMTVSINKHVIEGQGPIQIVPGRKNGEGYEAPLSKKLAELIKIRIKKSDKKQDEAGSIEAFIIEKASRKIEMSTLGQELSKKFPHFKYKDLGYSKLSKYIQSIPEVKVFNEGEKCFVEADRIGL